MTTSEMKVSFRPMNFAMQRTLPLRVCPLAHFCACGIAVIIGIVVSPDLTLTWKALLMVPVLALFAAIVEAISPHGWDNATMQLVPSLLAWLWL